MTATTRHAREDISVILEELQTDPSNGLTQQQVAEIQRTKGLNQFDEEHRETTLHKVFRHLLEVTSIILLIAASLSLFLAFQSGHGFTDPIIILAIVVVDTILAVRQELGAEKALEALKQMNAQVIVAVRDGVPQPIAAAQLVPGDIILFEAGDLIPADARLIEANNLAAEESALTGESVPVEKDATAIPPEKAPLGDQINMLFSGCLVTSGRARAVVVYTGMDTEMGKIAGLLTSTKKVRTPLQRRLTGLGKVLSVIAVVAAGLMFTLEFFYGEAILKILMNAVALAVAVVPETLPVIVTITLTVAVHRMAKRNAIIRKIPAVETLGSASVICSDKTGTLTMNRMSIKQVWAMGHEPMLASEQLGPKEMHLLKMMGLASNASIETVDGKATEIGDPTETAIIRLLKDKHIDKSSLDAIFPRVFELPFDSERKLMTTVHEMEEGGYISITKGAYDRMPVDAMTLCRDTARSVHNRFAAGALRVIALAFKHYDQLPANLNQKELEHGLTFAGFVGMIDPPRPESIEAVSQARDAGIRTIMITGDHPVTASAIAKEIGILGPGDRTLAGTELEDMSDQELRESIQQYSVYARVSPEDKIRIVKAWQAHGQVVAMTGDGVNDAPALKAADVGIAMGSGTDVAKSASDIVLTDDNFASIVDAVAEGRRVYHNVRKVLYSLLACNVSEIFIMILAILMRWGAPLVAIQLLLINVVADGVPDLFICREPDRTAMQRQPVKKNASIFSNGLGWKIAAMAAVFTVISLVGFYLGKYVVLSNTVEPSHAVGQTMAFVIVGWSSIVNILNVRSNRTSIFKLGLTSNRPLFYALCFSFLLVAATAGVPGLMDVFYCVPLSVNHWLIMIVLSFVPLAVGELQKIYFRRRP